MGLTTPRSIFTVPGDGYLVEYSRTSRSQEYRHIFCGPQNIAGAWCPNCSKPLLRILALATKDPRIMVPEMTTAYISLLYCWTCSLSQGEFAYRLGLTNDIEIIRFTSGGPTPGFPYNEYPTAFPMGAAILVRLSNSEQRAIEDMNRGTFDEGLHAEQQYGHLVAPRHQIGGEPRLMQGWVDVTCPICSQLVPFFASVSNDCLDPRGIIGYDYAQIIYHYCRACGVIVANNVCD
jgi:hypothetical protein